MYVLNANHISKSYKTAGETMRILQNVNLQVMKGEMVAIMGPSGSGKTTLLHVLTGVDTPDDGEIVIGGETFSQLTEEEKAFFRRKHMGMIFQDFQLLESLTVKENILLPLILERKEADIQQERFSRIEDVLGIEKLADKGITEISGGQKQRVAIGRALINEPDIIFGDEPTGSLDRKTTGDVMRCMKQMNQRSGISFLLVTHDAYTASFCDRVLFLQDGDLAKEVKKENTADNFREDIWKTLCGLGGGKDDLF
ncbi:ABC transporter ATP-binding protein [Coprococcus comes]|uniref:ABC transporter ATP-binding protein n=1 Tax=Coprococcus comes TaxID=410072 RepID=UPI0034A41BDA